MLINEKADFFLYPKNNNNNEKKSQNHKVHIWRYCLVKGKY